LEKQRPTGKIIDGTKGFWVYDALIICIPPLHHMAGPSASRQGTKNMSAELQQKLQGYKDRLSTLKVHL
jgi:hypothetical protein